MPPTIAARGGPHRPRASMQSSQLSQPSFPRKSIANGVAGKTIGTRGRAARHRKILRDTIHGVTKPAIRRLARRGGVKRISADIYDECRKALRQKLEQILHICAIYVEHRNAKTVTVQDVIFALRQIGRPIYGFDPNMEKSA